MDIVITYVNGLDPVWQHDYAQHIGNNILSKRFRDWGTLPYLLRGIETCMPYIRNVYLVVASDSQVPKWINRDVVRIVLHKDIIPSEFLPTFNSTAIEMFLHRIDGLSDEFIYFNDDFFPVKASSPSDFFQNGKVACHMARHLCTFNNIFRCNTHCSDHLARYAAKVLQSLFYVRPQHTVAPMLRHVCQELFEISHDEITKSVTPLRVKSNFNQYIYTDYAYFTGRTFRKRISNKHISLSISTLKQIQDSIVSPKSQFLCINDVQMSDRKFAEFKQGIHEAFEIRFPQKSRFEL